MNTPDTTLPVRFAAEIISRPPPPPGGSKRKMVLTVVLVAAQALLGAAAGFFVARHAGELMVRIPGPKWLGLCVAAALPLVWLAAVGIHEFGHLAGGWLGGGKFLLWQAGPLTVRRTPSGIRAGWSRGLNFWGGLAACIPLAPARLTPRRAAVMIVGGPAASLILGTVALWLATPLLTWNHPISAIRALAEHLAVLTALMSFLIFLVTTVPFQARGFKSDGRRVMDLLRGGRRSEQEAALLILTSATVAGVRPADFDPELVTRAISLKDGSLFDLYGHLTVFYHAADRGDWPAAQACLDYAQAGADQLSPVLRDSLRCEYAWLLATRAGDAAAARSWLDLAGKLEFDRATRLRAEAAVLLAEGKSVEAAAKAQAGLRMLEQRSMSPVKSPFAVAALEEILRQAHASRNTRT